MSKFTDVFLKYYRDVFAIWSAIAVVFLGLLAGSWRFANQIKYETDYFLVKSTDGMRLDGFYSVNPIVIFFVIVIILFLAGISVATFRESMRRRTYLAELDKSRLQYEDLLNCARNITAVNIYPEADGRPRLNIEKMYIRHIIERDGTTHVMRSYTFMCPKEKAHAYELWIEADEESDPVDGFRSLGIRIQDKTKGVEIDWIPTVDMLRRKRIVLFFPEMSPGETKEIEIRFKWPGFMKRVIEKGATEFWWKHKSASENATANVTYEWIYHNGFPQVRMRLRGRHTSSAVLKVEYTSDAIRWIYHDHASVIDSRDYAVAVEKGNAISEEKKAVD